MLRDGLKRVAFATTALCMIAGAATAADKVEMRYATAAPENTPWGTFLNDTIKDVETTEPSLDIIPFFSSQLGDEQTTLRQVVRGRIDISGQSGVATSLIVPEFALLGAPYLFRDTAQADCVFDNHVRPIFEDRMQNSGLVTLSWVEVGHSYISSKMPLKVAADIKGVKIRVPPSRSTSLYFDELGAAGVPLGVVDMVPGLKTGQVDAIATSTVYGLAIGLPKLAPHTLVFHATHDIGTVTVSKRIWEGLSDAQKQALGLVDARVNDLRKAIRGTEEFLLGKTAEAGAPVTRPTGADLDSWKPAAERASKRLVEEIGGDAAEIWARIQEAKAACT